MADHVGYPNLLASGFNQEDGYQPFHLFAGEKQVVTDQGVAGAGLSFAQFEVAARAADGTIIKYDPAAAAPANKAAVITAQPIPAGGEGPIYVEGIFNHAALVWPASVNTVAARKAAFDGTTIGVRKLL